jgi:hypothetical protein
MEFLWQAFLCVNISLSLPNNFSLYRQNYKKICRKKKLKEEKDYSTQDLCRYPGIQRDNGLYETEEEGDDRTVEVGMK